MTNDQISANTACFSDLTLDQCVDRIRRSGFQGLTLLAFEGTRHRYGELAGFWFRGLSSPQRQELKTLTEGFHRLAIHAPFADLPLFSYDPRLAELSMDRVKESVDAASYLGASIVIVHANPRANRPVHYYWQDMVAAFRSLGEYAGDRGVRIGVETGFPTDVDQFVDLLEAVGHFAVGATLDCGHMLRYVERDLWGTPVGAARLNELLIEMAQQLGPTIIHCQLHDVDESTWTDHQAVGKGVIDFRSFLRELQAIGYDGMLELELESTLEEQQEALEGSRNELERLIGEIGSQESAAA
ncbi:MAG TPA: sugar phosphate isomerase/epimerase family protein [Chloroflexota bacterium]|nr:sugar phosphate isomerase/epimerase family protein [Chloroflexota bacterium]